MKAKAKLLVFAVLWMGTFWVATIAFVMAINLALVRFFPDFLTEVASEWIGTIQALLLVAMPLLALVLCVLGKLPGTRRTSVRPEI
jgi:hypothetical protein